MSSTVLRSIYYTRPYFYASFSVFRYGTLEGSSKQIQPEHLPALEKSGPKDPAFQTEAAFGSVPLCDPDGSRRSGNLKPIVWIKAHGRAETRRLTV